MAKIKQATKKTGRARKEQIVAELVEKIDNSSGLVFTDYKGLPHKQLEDLKRELKKLNSTIVIAKNSLLKLSLQKSKNYADIKDNDGLNLPTATVFIRGDMVEPLKKIAKAIKDFGLPKIKFGILEGNLTDEAGVLKLASLPNKEALLAQFVGTLNSPISGLVFTLNATIQKFVMTLDAISKTKPSAPALPTQSQSSLQGEALEPQTLPSEPEAISQEQKAGVEPAVSAGEPARQPDLSAEASAKAEAPVETDEAPDADTEV